MTNRHSHFQFGFIIGGLCLVVLLQSYPVRLRKVVTFGLQTPLPMKLIQKKYNFSESSTLPEYFVGNTDIKTFCLIHFPYLWYVFTKSDGGMNTRWSSMAKKMLNISAKQKLKNSPFKTSILLTKGKKLHVVHLRLPKWKSFLPIKIQGSYPRNNEISSKFSKMTQQWDKSFDKNALTMMTQMTDQV